MAVKLFGPSYFFTIQSSALTIFSPVRPCFIKIFFTAKYSSPKGSFICLGSCLPGMSEVDLPFLKLRTRWLLWGVLAFALVLRLKYLTVNTGMWFDEAEYLAIAKHWAFGLPYEVPYIRPVLFPLIAAGVFLLGGGEGTLLVIQLLFSLVGVYALFLLGRSLYDEATGLFAAFLLSIFYLHLFFTPRFLVDVSNLTMWTLV